MQLEEVFVTSQLTGVLSPVNHYGLYQGRFVTSITETAENDYNDNDNNDDDEFDI